MSTSMQSWETIAVPQPQPEQLRQPVHDLPSEWRAECTCRMECSKGLIRIQGTAVVTVMHLE